MSLDYTDQTIPIVHLEIVRDSSIEYSTVQVKTSAEIVDLLTMVIGKRNTENLLVCAVDANRQPVLLQIIGIGTLDYCQFSLADIWKAALLCNAAGIIVSHNHPSSKVTPSYEDIEATKNMIRAGATLEIPLLDHIIASGEEFYSFRESKGNLWDEGT